MSDDKETAEYKIKLTPDTKEIDELEKKLDNYEKQGKDVKARLNLGPDAPAGADRVGSTLDTFVNKLSRLVDKNQRREDEKKDEAQKIETTSLDLQKQIAGYISKIPTALSSPKNFLGIVGGALGSFAGPIGTVVGGIVGDLVGKGIDKSLQGFMDVLHENLKLRVFSEQTGKTTEALYKLKTQADLVGYSLEGIIRTNASLADEIVGGTSIEKSQLLMSAGVDLKDLYGRHGGNIERINQEIFNKVDAALQDLPASLRAAQLRRFGFSDEEQTARRHMFEPGVLQETRKVMDFATAGGKVPITPAYAVQAQATQFLGAQAELEGALRALFSTKDFAMKVSSTYVELQAQTVNFVNQALNSNQAALSIPQTYEKAQKTITTFTPEISSPASAMYLKGAKEFQQQMQSNMERNRATNKVATPR